MLYIYISVSLYMAAVISMYMDVCVVLCVNCHADNRNYIELKW